MGMGVMKQVHPIKTGMYLLLRDSHCPILTPEEKGKKKEEENWMRGPVRWSRSGDRGGGHNRNPKKRKRKKEEMFHGREAGSGGREKAMRSFIGLWSGIAFFIADNSASTEG